MGTFSKLPFWVDFRKWCFNSCCLTQWLLLKQTIDAIRKDQKWCYKHGLAMGMLSVVKFSQYLQLQIYRGGQEHRSPHLLVLAAALGGWLYTALHCHSSLASWSQQADVGHWRGSVSPCSSWRVGAWCWVLYGGGRRIMPQQVIRCARGKAHLVPHASPTALAPAAAWLGKALRH